MAKMEIYQSQAQAKTQKSINVGEALSLPFSLAQNLGGAIDKLTANIKNASDKRKATQNQNEARELLKEIEPVIAEEFKKTSLSSNIDDVNTFYKNTSYNTFSNIIKKSKANKKVKELVANEIFTTQKDFAGKLYGTITKNHYEETKAGHDDDLNKILPMMSSNDGHTMAMGYKKFYSWFNNPINKEKYTAADFIKLKKSKLADARKLQLQFQIRNDHWSILNKTDEINKEFGEKEGKLILDKAKIVAVSKMKAIDFENKRIEKASASQKIANFAEIIERLRNTDDIQYLEKIPTLDYLDDMFKENQLNSAQYAMLLDFYSTGGKASDSEVIDKIDAQLAVMKSVDDIDALERQINFDQGFVAKLNIDDISAYKEIFEKYKKDQTGFLDYQYYLDQVETDLGKVESSGTILAVSGASADQRQEIQRTRIRGKRLYNDLIRKNVAPADAYIQTVGNLLKSNTLPTIYNVVPFQSGLKLEKPKPGTDPEVYFTKKRETLVDLYKANQIGIDTFMNDMGNMDTVEDLLNLRMSLMDQSSDKAFAEKTSAPIQLKID